jgi:5'-nucleotidase
MPKLCRLSVVIFILAASCAAPHPPSPPSDAANDSGKGDVESLVILGTNDIHGNLVPVELKTREVAGVNPVNYEAGGAAVLASYIKLLRAKYGAHLVWLDAGDEFQGTIESNTNLGSPVVQFFNANGLNAAAIGNHEFDFGALAMPSPTPGSPDLLGVLKARLTQAQYPYLAANIVDRSTGQLAQLPNLHPHVIINAGRLKVGVIGLSTLDTPKTTRAENVAGLEFSSLHDATIREAKALRNEGADVVVITAHVGLKCEPGRTYSGDSLRKQIDPQGDCGPQDEMVQLLKSIPPGTVDAVVAGHSHQIVHHWINGIPVVQGGAYDRYFNLIYLNYDLKKHAIIPDKTRIEGPIPICEHVFSNQNDCNGERPVPNPIQGEEFSPENNGRGKWVPMKFHGETITPDAATTELLKPVVEGAEKVKNQVLATAARTIEHTRTAESQLGNLVADAIRESAKADVALVNSGGIRTSIEAGPITYGNVFQAIPFDNRVAKLNVTGKELKLILRVAESGSRGVAPVSGVKLVLIEHSSDAPSDDLNHDGKIELWEENRIVEESMADGTPIRDDGKYSLATLDFLVSGGDDVGWAMKQIPPERMNSDTGVVIRDAVVAHLTAMGKLGEINAVDHPLVDPDHPRIKLIKPVKRVSKKKSRRRKKSKRKSA